LLRSAGIVNAQLALITFDHHDKALKGQLMLLPGLKPGLAIVVRPKKITQSDDFYSGRASQVVPEAQGSSLMRSVSSFTLYGWSNVSHI